MLASEYLDLRLSHAQLLDAALQMENHPDNLAAALWGGAVASGVSEAGRYGESALLVMNHLYGWLWSICTIYYRASVLMVMEHLH